jgi:glycosyltransferase involved in cell wall biosynthesis
MGTRAIRIARARGLRLFYDVDDLIFDEEGASHLDKFSQCPSADRAIERNREAMILCDAVFCSTSYLQERAARFHPNVVIMKNGLSQRLFDLATKQATRPDVARSDVTLGYFSGSRHHDADFGLVQSALQQIMRDFPQTRLLLAGKLTFDPAFYNFGDRFEHRNFMPYAQFIRMPGTVDINLVPLVQSDPFAQARSELKYIEAGAFGVPSVASPIRSYREAISHGKNGLICEDGEWYAKLAGLVLDKDFRHRLGRAAREDVLENSGPSRRAREWNNVLTELLGASTPTHLGRASVSDVLPHYAEIRNRAFRRWAKSLRGAR